VGERRYSDETVDRTSEARVPWADEGDEGGNLQKRKQIKVRVRFDDKHSELRPKERLTRKVLTSSPTIACNDI